MKKLIQSLWQKTLRLLANPYLTILRYKLRHPKATLYVYVPTYGKKGYYTATSVHLLKEKSTGRYIIAIHTDCK